MKKKIVIIIIFFFMGIFTNCQNKETKIKDQMKKGTLIDGIALDNSIFSNKDIDLKKYKFNGILIENINLNDLLDKNYRDDFIKFLLITKNEDDSFKSTLVSQLLIIRMIQLYDTDAFYILSEISKNESISYNGIELYQETLLKFFIENPMFYIQQGSKYNDSTIIKSISNSLDEFIADENFFKDNIANINLESQQMLLYPEKEKEFNANFKNTLKKLPKVEAIFSPSSYTAWESKTIYFTNIYSLFTKAVTQKLTTRENVYYKSYILPILKKYTSLGYVINDPDGYTNLRKDKSASSEILQKITTGEEIIVLDNSGDWWLVESKDGKKGYVYKTKIKEE